MFEEDLLGKVADDPAVAVAVAKNSIAWGDRPQASALPGITFELIGGSLEQHMQDFQALQRAPVQASVWSLDRIEARNLRKALIAAVVPVATIGATAFRRSFVDRQRSSFERLEDSSIVYREDVDFSVWHAAAA